MTDFRYRVEDGEVAVITWDVPNAKMNTMSWESLEELAGYVETAFADPDVRGVVLTSAKADFSGGMDLAVLASIKEQSDTAESAFQTVMRFHRTLRKIELGGIKPRSGGIGKPVVAALPGTAVGIGYEIALCCHRIIAADNPKALIGLPEVKVGLFPGAGGTTRVIRRLGIVGGGPLLHRGTTLPPRKALEVRMIDEVVEPDNLLKSAKRWVYSAKSDQTTKPWDTIDNRDPKGGPNDRDGYPAFVAACAMLSASGGSVYPASRALMSAIYEGAMVPFDQALEVEARWFTKVLLEKSSSNMIRTAFLDKKALEKGLRRPASVSKFNLNKVGIVGAGMMGAGIALMAARGGLDVVLIDRDLDRATAGKSNAGELLAHRVKKGNVSHKEAQDIVDRIKTAADFKALEGADIVIEAVFEDPAVKARVIADIDAATDCIIATNTSTLPLSELAKACRDRSRFLGMHFFSPVDRMLLVEIIRGEDTSEVTLATALDCAARMRKTPIVVNDGRYFFANRCIIPYLNEGIRMVGEGIPPALIENSARQCGMPVGPLQLIDETSIDLAVSIAKATRQALGERYQHEEADRVIFKLASIGRLGRKAKAGFYEYDDQGRRIGLWRGLNEYFPVVDKLPDPSSVRERLLMIQALEAVRTLQEGVLTDVREGDVGAVLGWGFAPWSGGPFKWLDMLLASGEAMAMCDSLRVEYGSRFSPPELLRYKATNSERFAA